MFFFVKVWMTRFQLILRVANGLNIAVEILPIRLQYAVERFRIGKIIGFEHIDEEVDSGLSH